MNLAHSILNFLKRFRIWQLILFFSIKCTWSSRFMCKSLRGKAGIFDAWFAEILRSLSCSGQKITNFNLIQANLASQFPASQVSLSSRISHDNSRTHFSEFSLTSGRTQRLGALSVTALSFMRNTYPQSAAHDGCQTARRRRTLRVWKIRTQQTPRRHTDWWNVNVGRGRLNEQRSRALPLMWVSTLERFSSVRYVSRIFFIQVILV